MSVTPYELYQFIQTKGYVPPMAGQVTVDSMTQGVQNKQGSNDAKFVGTGEHLKEIMENDRRAVFQAFYGSAEDAPLVESTWLAGEDGGMLMPEWQERMVHAEMMYLKGNIDSSMDYLLHVMAKRKLESK